ncbi:hypothetical protein KC19_3G163000 [Ceratodon purpureus]|uniref:Secreted protein n=1 Tax=Ceratodon purpureus TaxID=3225 RepID=A0A8T0ILJ4_CERPU|nr:hypothetical protein KC19_3G163000 [Ceratodon purpureus]
MSSWINCSFCLLVLFYTNRGPSTADGSNEYAHPASYSQRLMCMQSVRSVTLSSARFDRCF